MFQERQNSAEPFAAVLNVVRVSGDWSQVDLQGDGAADGFVFLAFLAAA